MQSFDIHFSGKLLAGKDPQQVRTAIGKLFKIDGDALERLFSGRATRIKKDVDVDAANRYRAIFRDAGALVDIVPHGQGPANGTKKSATTATQKASLTLLPANTGSLEDCAMPVQAQVIPDISDIILDAPGAILDESPGPANAEIDVSSLSMQPANTGSLEDCQATQAEVVIPDISYIQLIDEQDN